MSLVKTIVFLSPLLLGRYDRLAKRHRVSRSEALRTAAELGYDLVRERLAARPAAAPALTGLPPGATPGAHAQAVLAVLRAAAAIVVRAQPDPDAAFLRELLLEEAAKYPDVVLPDGALDAIVDEFAAPDSPELQPLPGDVPPK